jgi:hypothetical protein
MHQVATLRKSLTDSNDSRLLKALADLDEDSDGNIDVFELLQYVGRAAKHEDTVQQLKWVAGAGLVLVLMMSLAVFGVSWGVVTLTRELSTAVRHQSLQTKAQTQPASCTECKCTLLNSNRNLLKPSTTLYTCRSALGPPWPLSTRAAVRLCALLLQPCRLRRFSMTPMRYWALMSTQQLVPTEGC